MKGEDVADEPCMLRRVLCGSLWGVGGQGMTIAASIVATPFVIRELGSEAYGVLNLINLFIGTFAFADFGMGTASTRFAADAYERGDMNGEAQVVWMSLLLMAGPTTLVALALYLGASSVAVGFLRLPPPLAVPATTAFQVAAVGLVARNLVTVLNTPQTVRLRLGLVTLINSGCGVTQVVTVPLVLTWGGGLAGAAVVISSSALVAAILHGAVGLWLNPRLLRPWFVPELVGPLACFGGALAISALTHIGLSNGEKLLLSRYGSMANLAHYSVAFTLAGVLGLAPGTIAQALLPAFSRLQAPADRKRLRQLYSEAIGSVFLLTVPAGASLCVLAKPFLTYWAGPEFGRESILPFYILAMGLIVNVIAYVPYTLLTALGRTRQVARYHLIELIPYLLWTGFLTFSFGAVGAATALSTRILFGAVWCLVTVRGLLGTGETCRKTSFRQYLESLAGPLACVLLVATLNPGLGVRATVTIGMLSVYGVVVWTRFLSYDQKVRLRIAAGRLSFLAPPPKPAIDEVASIMSTKSASWNSSNQ